MNVHKALQLAVKNYQADNLQEAENICKKIVKVQANNITAINLLGIISYQLKNYDSSMQYMKKLINLNPNDTQAHYILGHSMQEKGQMDEAIIHYQKSLKLNPNFADAYYNLGIIFQDKKRYDEAISCYQNSLQSNPTDISAIFNIGLSLQEKKQFDEAITFYQKALELNPRFDAAYGRIGFALQEKEQIDEAISFHMKAIELNPENLIALIGLGTAFEEKGQFDEAATYYQKVLQLIPNHDQINHNLAFMLQQTCNWQELEVLTARLDGLSRKALDTGTKFVETPFMSFTRNANPSINFAIAKSWSHDIKGAMSNLKIHFSFNDRKTGKTKIVIGYLSDRFGNTATAHLMRGLFGLHNRDEFSIYCYSYGKDDRSSYRARIEQDCDKFVDISCLSDDTAARCIYEDQVDILVDLKGHTKGNRLAICALHPAPIQVIYLGFPGTTGADFIDYIITDKIVTPEDHSPYYSEKCVYMPHCYQVNDHTQPIANKDWEKADFGLPEGFFVFCSFNQPYKIDPIIFDVWMKILLQVSESVLWLLFDNKIAEENLRQEAEARGVKSERLIFAKSLPKNEHLSRLKLADLALDTRIVNGHTTTSDALWAGVPVTTLQGSHFASRVSSSILSAIGLPDLITYSLEAYEALAVRLAKNPVDIQEIQKRIVENRTVEPLFDTPRFVRNLEIAYKEMCKIFLTGETPRQIEVLES
jgi:protein O-GlcNAc transferase